MNGKKKFAFHKQISFVGGSEVTFFPQEMEWENEWTLNSFFFYRSTDSLQIFPFFPSYNNLIFVFTFSEFVMNDIKKYSKILLLHSLMSK